MSAQFSITDTHCHLDFPDFADDLENIVARAMEAGVERLITISTNVKKSAQYQAIAEKFPNVWFSIGTHPNSVKEEPDISLEEILKVASHPKCVAIGEAGLDYHYDYSPIEDQKRSFLMHIEAARRTSLPLVIHARSADDDMIAILEEEMAKGRFSAVLHCFSSSAELAKRGVELGLYVSFSGILTFKNSESIREIAKNVPLDRLLVETDAPYLSPTPHRGKRNEPAFTKYTASILAVIFGMTLQELAPILEENTNRLFLKLSAR